MAKGRWVKDICPFAKDQGFNSVIGDEAPGETVFGFTHTMSGTTETLTFKTETVGLVTQMADKNYRVLVTKSSTGSIVAATTAAIGAKLETTFAIRGESGKAYDIIVIGRVLY